MYQPPQLPVFTPEPVEINASYPQIQLPSLQENNIQYVMVQQPQLFQTPTLPDYQVDPIAIQLTKESPQTVQTPAYTVPTYPSSHSPVPMDHSSQSFY